MHGRRAGVSILGLTAKTLTIYHARIMTCPHCNQNVTNASVTPITVVPNDQARAYACGHCGACLGVVPPDYRAELNGIAASFTHLANQIAGLAAKLQRRVDGREVL